MATKASIRRAKLGLPEIDEEEWRKVIPKLGQRARIVLNRILDHGDCSTEWLQEQGYDHAPRAAQDLKDAGVPLKSHKKDTNSKTGNRMSSYYLPDRKPSEVKAGRKQPPKKFKKDLIKKYGQKDQFTGQETAGHELTMDHRTPYDVGGDPDIFDVKDWMLLGASSQQRKKHACSNCENQKTIKDPAICRRCYWAYPEDFDHVAMENLRRIDVEFRGSDVDKYNQLEQYANRMELSIGDAIRFLISEFIDDDS